MNSAAPQLFVCASSILVCDGDPHAACPCRRRNAAARSNRATNRSRSSILSASPPNCADDLRRVTGALGRVCLQRCFPENGTFTPKTIKGRRYWYFQVKSTEGRSQRYVGPESPEPLERIAHHKQAQDDERERRALVSALVRSSGR